MTIQKWFRERKRKMTTEELYDLYRDLFPDLKCCQKFIEFYQVRTKQQKNINSLIVFGKISLLFFSNRTPNYFLESST